MNPDFSIWAPKCQSIDIISPSGETVLALEKNNEGYFQGNLPANLKTGHLEYQLLLNGEQRRPDPKAEYFLNSVHGTCVKDFSDYTWQTPNWKGQDKKDLIIYELHIGCFTQAGTFQSVLEKLPYLKELGVTAIELMPLAECPGRWNWGYDGVGLFAVNNNYGTPREFKHFVDTCHAEGISVILDVVYNHIGPEGNYLGEFGHYFSRKHGTPWGDAFNFDGKNSKPVRQFIIDNVLFWLDTYQLDGLRLDAIHFMKDESEYAIQQEICNAVRAYEKNSIRPIHLIGETNVYDHQLILNQKNDNYCAIWADDLMHSIYSLAGVNEHLTPRNYQQEKDVNKVLKDGYVYEGPDVKRVPSPQKDIYHGKDRNLSHLSSLITALQTHDSCGNHPQGKRIHQVTSVEFQRAALPLILLYPAIPMLFMGEEISAENPFIFFADFGDEHLRNAVDKGRKNEFPDVEDEHFINPCDDQAFFLSKLDLERGDSETLGWYKQLIQIRKSWIQSGLLQADNLTVETNSDTNRFALIYKNENQKAYVIVQLNGKADISIRFNAKWQINSHTPLKQEDLVPDEQKLSPTHAIIGEGEIQWPFLKT